MQITTAEHMKIAESQSETVPFVSVVVPVYNDAARIQTCIAALLAQTYPRERYEVLIVDNGSTDATRAAVAPFPVTLLVEDQITGSYAARNAGLAAARGTIIAFTDSDCTPQPGWLAAGVQALAAQHADLAGGNVRFVASSRPTGAEVYDMIAHLKVERYIHEDGAAVTANLFVQQAVFDAIGAFPVVQSGGDMLFTQRATQAGYTLVYAPAAEVTHPTRQFAELLRKQFRVGKGHRAIRATQRAAASSAAVSAATAHPARRGTLGKLRRIAKGLRPEPLGSIRRAMHEHDLPRDPALLARVWGAAWLAQVAKTVGNLSLFK